MLKYLNEKYLIKNNNTAYGDNKKNDYSEFL